ncbi:MAG: hypothetical protein ACTSVO_05465, partial [Candidatus Heimdallarchaeaceae archaeon]
ELAYNLFQEVKMISASSIFKLIVIYINFALERAFTNLLSNSQTQLAESKVELFKYSFQVLSHWIN